MVNPTLYVPLVEMLILTWTLANTSGFWSYQFQSIPDVVFTTNTKVNMSSHYGQRNNSVTKELLCYIVMTSIVTL